MDKTHEKYVVELMEWLRIKSISSDVTYSDQMDRGAEWLVARLHNLGFAAKKMETSFKPVVFGELLKAGKEKPTVLI